MLNATFWLIFTHCNKVDFFFYLGKKCNDKLGWMYEFALEENQRYKESHVILEKALIREKEGFVEDIPA